ncbi:hypothetical protein CBR_g22236 [Chara braunii]|uniref:Reverse transcriptase domain-containing protein n=1 Tax=Chara braunii TaxID=69332 RepID=A0A388L2K2_CHABU|nr:hypothetical protein CBR_g22236 [Chara braunii]|eukprot:GBG76488.1 hypothetical protein CBR_g22236 [Chara braunii]
MGVVRRTSWQSGIAALCCLFSAAAIFSVCLLLRDVKMTARYTLTGVQVGCQSFQLERRREVGFGGIGVSGVLVGSDTSTACHKERDLCGFHASEIERIISLPHGKKSREKRFWLDGQWRNLRSAWKIIDKKRAKYVCMIMSVQEEVPCLRKDECLLPLYVRPNASDLNVVRQLFEHQEYSFVADFHPKTILDAGGNVGMASVIFATLDGEDTREDDRILRSARRPIAHLALGPEGDRYLFRRRRERLQQQRRARATVASRAFVSEAAASVAMATSAQQSSQASSSGAVGSTVAQTQSQSTGVMASQPLVMTPEEVAIQRAADREAQLQQALGEIKAEKERMIRRRARMQRRQADVGELEEMDTTEMEDDMRTIRNQLAGEANINVHNFPLFSKKALDLEAKIGHGHNPTTDGRKKTLPPNWKAKAPKGRIMFVDNDGSTIELDDNFQEGVGSEDGSGEASGGGVVAAVAQKGEPVKMPSEIEGVVAKYPDLFEELTGVVEREVVHTIEIIPGSSIPKGRIYRMSPSELDELRRQLKELVGKGWIRRSGSPYGSPVLFVPKKKEGTLRMCIDYRGLNAITVKNREPLPRIDDLLDRVQGCRYFNKINLKSEYHLIAIRPEDQHKTAFQTRYGLYEFVVMPFGLCNTPGTFQHAMNRTFHDYLDKFAIMYLDDILIFSKTVEEHVAHLDKLLSLLRQHKFKINRKKCEFGRIRVLY